MWPNGSPPHRPVELRASAPRPVKRLGEDHEPRRTEMLDGDPAGSHSGETCESGLAEAGGSVNRVRSLITAMLTVCVGFWACGTTTISGPSGLVTVTFTSLTPTSGSTAGGTVVTIKGKNFLLLSAIDSVRFGGEKAPLFSIVNDSLGTVTTPAHAPGPVAVTLFVHAADTVSIPNAFTYIVPSLAPVLTSVTPSSGPTAGGTAIVVSGTAFQTGATVTVGGTGATGVTVVPTSIGALTPAGTVGAKSVVVTNPDGMADTLAAAFTYTTGALPVFQDNFDTGARAGPQSGYQWSPPGGQQPPAVSNTRAFSGAYSLKFGFGPDAATPGDDSSSEQRFVLGAYLSEVWVEYMLYVPTNFYHRKVPGDTHNNKFFVLWRDTYSGSSDWLVDVEFEAQFDPRNDGTSRIRPTTGTGIVYNIPNPQLTTANLINNGVTPVTGAWAITPGNWTRIRIHVRMSTGVGTNDGVLEMWANNALFFAKTNGNFIGTTGVRDLRNGYLLGYANSGFNNLTEMFVDDFKIYDANPLW